MIVIERKGTVFLADASSHLELNQKGVGVDAAFYIGIATFSGRLYAVDVMWLAEGLQSSAQP
jgi:uncharacterized membrane protein YgdD (TMEM256/DUF423 family)